MKVEAGIGMHCDTCKNPFPATERRRELKDRDSSFLCYPLVLSCTEIYECGDKLYPRPSPVPLSSFLHLNFRVFLQPFCTETCILVGALSWWKILFSNFKIYFDVYDLLVMFIGVHILYRLLSHFTILCSDCNLLTWHAHFCC
jgi:hypothetical protein